MRRSGYLVPSRLPRRAAIFLALALPAMGLVITTAAVPAEACSLSSHCYAIAIANDTTTNHGMYGNVYASCLYNSNDQNFVNNEMWDVGGSYWEEVGLKSGTAFDGTYYSAKTWFWADNRPNYGYSEHEPNIASAGTNINYAVQIIYDSNQKWSIWGGNSFALIGASTSQSATLNNGQAGTEYTSYGGADMRNTGNVNGLERESTAGDFYLWGNASLVNNGYITGSYNNAKESWAWSC